MTEKRMALTMLAGTLAGMGIRTTGRFSDLLRDNGTTSRWRDKTGGMEPWRS